MHVCYLKLFELFSCSEYYNASKLFPNSLVFNS